jgi:hypothetical protein
MLAIVGNGEAVETQLVVAYEYNMKTGVLIILTPGMAKIEIDTKVDKVVVAESGVICNTFKGVTI